MYYYQDQFIAPTGSDFHIDMIKNPNTLNIFSDASMRSRAKNVLDTCYGAVAVHMDNIIEELFRMNSESTVPAAEIRGIRCALSLALKYRYQYPVINIFCDSLLSIDTMRNYIYGWRFKSDGRLYSKSSALVKNQELYVECWQMLTELRKTNRVNLYHQPGHVDNGLKALQDAIQTFKNTNNIKGQVDYNTIRYISLYNNYVDAKSRSFIRHINIYENTYIDPLTFYPNPDTFNNSRMQIPVRRK